MTVLEKKKFRLIRAIINDTDEKRVAEIEKIYKKLSKQEKLSFMCSLDELRECLDLQEKDLAEGKIELIPHEQLKRKAIL